MQHERRVVLKAKHDPDSFLELYDHYHPKLYAYVLSKIRHRERAEDIVQQTFVKALEKINNFKWKRNATFGSWLFTIARNELIDQVRRDGRVQTEPEDFLQVVAGATEDAEFEMIEKEDTDQVFEKWRTVQSAIANLSEQEQELIRLKYFANMSYKSIGILMSKKPNTLAVALRRSLHKIQEALSV